MGGGALSVNGVFIVRNQFHAVKKCLALIILLNISCRKNNDDAPIIFVRGPIPQFCVPLETAEGDEIFLLFKKFSKGKLSQLFGAGKPIWRIYGPLKCGDKISFWAKKDLQVENGRVFLEVGAHFTVNYDVQTKAFEVVGGQ